MTGNEHDSLVRRQFGASAANYRTSATHARGASLTRLLALLQPSWHWQVLDAATGAGHTAAALSPRVRTVVAGDMTPEMLTQAKAVCRERKLTNVFLVQENATALAYRDRTFDLVTCRVAAHHFPSPSAFVGECSRVLKPDGILAIIDNIVPDNPAGAEWINDFERQRDPSHAKCLSMRQWQECYQQYGFTLVHSEVNPKWFDFADWMRRMNPDPGVIEAMERRLYEAPQGVRDFWLPMQQEGRARLALQEAILIGRASH